MPVPEKHTKVLIVGAGPSGLMMAAQLLRHGLQPVIIDTKQGPTNQSKALAVQARSLEIYRQMGLASRLIKDGREAGGVTLYNGGENMAALSLQDVGKGQTAFPFIHLYQQSKNERLLLDFLTLNCCPVYWETTLMLVRQSAGGCEVQLQSSGEPVTLTCDWLIGADGAHSAVRKQLQIPFKGDTYQHNFYLADVELDNRELNEGDVKVFLAKKGFAAFFPMPEDRRNRIIGNLPDELAQSPNLGIEDIMPSLNANTRLLVRITNTYWFTGYRLHHRMADTFRDQRCFLIGDAAHIHSPVGGQGMNTGLQDAYNLAWKLAGVADGRLNDTVLESYAAERMPVAKDLLNTTDRVFTMVMSRNWFAGLFKKFVLPHLLKIVWKKQAWREAFFKRVSQLNISYRYSKLSLHMSQSTGIKAGDRLPYLRVFDEKKQAETDLHQWCDKPGFTFIAMGKLAEADLFTLARWITQKYPALLNFYYLPPSAKNQAVYDAFEVKPNRGKSLIVRPDMYIGFMNDAVDMVLMDKYLRDVVGVLITG